MPSSSPQKRFAPGGRALGEPPHEIPPLVPLPGDVRGEFLLAYVRNYVMVNLADGQKLVNTLVVLLNI